MLVEPTHHLPTLPVAVGGGRPGPRASSSRRRWQQRADVPIVGEPGRAQAQTSASQVVQLVKPAASRGNRVMWVEELCHITGKRVKERDTYCSFDRS